ncbi:apolipoprotein D-like [Aphidius gifuensis]|uniref:apolipoprotein D-like n=1 Tax=Aphidius gifuensis TaxID=684658 RepID=UPI001CDB7DAA|nr:apolipoprotein D-like [Aphidius gifuensis]
MFLIFCLLSLFAANSMAQLSVLQRPHFKPMDYLNLTRFAGYWYEYERIPNIFELAVRCSRAKVMVDENQSTVSLLFSETGSFSGKDYKVLTTGTQKRAAVFEFKFPLYLININLATIYVLDTDYENFVVLAGGFPFGDHGFLQMAWINSRTPELSHEHHARALEALRNSGVATDALVRVRQNC